MADYNTPGVYIEEIPHLPPSIVSVETAIPAFTGYTEKAQLKEPGDLTHKPWRIASMLEYEQFFGLPDTEKDSLSVVFTNTGAGTEVNGKVDPTKRSKFLMHYSLQMFFANGGGACWINSVGNYQLTGGNIISQNLRDGLNEVAKINEVTLLLFPDAINLDDPAGYYDVYSAAIDQCVTLLDRFVIMDVYQIPGNPDGWEEDIKALRKSGLDATISGLKYAAVYFPQIYTSVDFKTGDDAAVIIEGEAAGTLAALKNTNNAQYFQAKNALANIEMLLPASAALAGIYAQVDNSRGVWKAPANVNIVTAIRPQYLITSKEQEDLNVDAAAGKSINVIRSFPGRGPAIVWGARTLAGNDNEWRYIPVRRYFNMVEESVKNGTEQFVFEPNDTNTWIRVKSMIQNFLTQQWKAGALMGTSTKEAFFVHVGLGETMTEIDVWEGRMIIEIGQAVVRPAEFVILRFMHKMLAES
ncbi:MAG: phage tail sheath C-terminal domain-containing protein [Ferruginibacter sp.]